jgi:hypothetical protein
MRRLVIFKNVISLCAAIGILSVSPRALIAAPQDASDLDSAVGSQSRSTPASEAALGASLICALVGTGFLIAGASITDSDHSKRDSYFATGGILWGSTVVLGGVEHLLMDRGNKSTTIKLVLPSYASATKRNYGLMFEYSY